MQWRNRNQGQAKTSSPAVTVDVGLTRYDLTGGLRSHQAPPPRRAGNDFTYDAQLLADFCKIQYAHGGIEAIRDFKALVSQTPPPDGTAESADAFRQLFSDRYRHTIDQALRSYQMTEGQVGSYQLKDWHVPSAGDHDYRRFLSDAEDLCRAFESIHMGEMRGVAIDSKGVAIT